MSEGVGLVAVVDLLNTLDQRAFLRLGTLHQAEDRLTTVAALEGWFDEHDLPSTASPADLDTARTLRDGLRAALLATGPLPEPSTPPEPVGAGTLPEPVEARTLPEPAEAGSLPEPAEAGTPPEPAEAGTPPEPAEAGTPPEPAEAGTPPEPVEAGTPPEPVEAGTLPEPVEGPRRGRRPNPTTDVLAAFPLRLRADDGRVRLVADTGSANLDAVVETVATAVADGRWKRLKLCASEDCRWAYLDTSRSGGGRWCSMETCGNRHKTRAYRRRRAG